MLSTKWKWYPHKRRHSLWKLSQELKKANRLHSLQSTHVVYRACIASPGENFRALALSVYDTLTLISKFQKGKSSEQYWPHQSSFQAKVEFWPYPATSAGLRPPTLAVLFSAVAFPVPAPLLQLDRRRRSSCTHCRVWRSHTSTDACITTLYMHLYTGCELPNHKWGHNRGCSPKKEVGTPETRLKDFKTI